MTTAKRIPELFSEKTYINTFYNNGLGYYQESKETPFSIDKVDILVYCSYKAVGAGRKDGSCKLLDNPK